MNAALDTSGLRARAHTAQISTPPRYAHTLCSLLTDLTKSTLPIIDSLAVPTRSTGSELTECSKRFLSSWVSTQVSTWGELLRAPYSCADYPLPKESSPERQEPTLRMAEQFHVKPCHLLSAAPYTIRNRTDDTAIIRRHSPRGGGSATHCRRTQLFTSRTVHVPLAAVFHRCAGSRNAAPSHVSRETKAHPFPTGLDLMSASYVVADTEVGPRLNMPRPHRCTHL